MNDAGFNPYKMPTNVTIDGLKKEKSPFAKITLELRKHSDAIKKLYEKRASLYSEYLRSNEWKEKRKIMLDLVGNKCEACGCTKNLVCHHGSYDKVGYEPLHHLFILCENCHTEYHSKQELGISIEQTAIFIQDKLGTPYKRRK